MKDAMLLCTLIAVLGALLRFIAETAGGKTAEKLIGMVTGLLIILTLIEGSIGNMNLRITFVVEEREEDFNTLAEETFDAVCAEAETRLSESLAEELELAFGATVESCSVTIDRKTLNASGATVVFCKKDFLIGSYEVKKYIYDQFGVEAEVFFE